MFVATWRVGPEAELGSDITWTEAVAKALVISARSQDRDELIKIEWRETGR